MVLHECGHGNFINIERSVIIPDNQGGAARHKCIICAYEAGRKEEYLRG